MAKIIILSPFGEFLKRHNVSKAACAEALGITASYVSMLSRSAATPGFKLAMRVSEWSKKVSQGTETFGSELWIKVA